MVTIKKFKESLLAALNRDKLNVPNTRIEFLVNEGFAKIATMTEPIGWMTRVKELDTQREIEPGLFLRKPKYFAYPDKEKIIVNSESLEIYEDSEITTESIIKYTADKTESEEPCRIVLPVNPTITHIMVDFVGSNLRDILWQNVERVGDEQLMTEKESLNIKFVDGKWFFSKNYAVRPFTRQDTTREKLLEEKIENELDIEEELLPALCYFVAAHIEPQKAGKFLTIFADRIYAYNNRFLKNSTDIKKTSSGFKEQRFP